WLSPYTPLLPGACWRFWRETGETAHRAGRLLVIWPAAVLIFFSLSSSRIEYYSLPALPPLALLLGWRFKRYLDTPGDRGPLWALLIIGLLGLTLLLSMSDQIPGLWLRQHAAAGDLVVMEQIEEYEYGASLAFYADRPILMVKRQGLPQFPHPVPPAKDYLITPEQLQNLWQGPDRVFLLIDDATPPEPWLQGVEVPLALPGKRLLANR